MGNEVAIACLFSCLKSADFDGIMETLCFTCRKGKRAFAVFEFAAEAFIVGMALPWFKAEEGSAALRGSPEAPEGIVFRYHGNFLIALAGADGYFI